MSSETVDMNVTVNEMVAAHPETIPVFNRFGLDTCCGGGVAITQAAHRDGVDFEVLRQALHDAIAAVGVA